jgi:hypothetical protein
MSIRSDTVREPDLGKDSSSCGSDLAKEFRLRQDQDPRVIKSSFHGSNLESPHGAVETYRWKEMPRFNSTPPFTKTGAVIKMYSYFETVSRMGSGCRLFC